MAVTEAQIGRILEHQEISRDEVLVVTLFLRGHRETSLVRALFEFLHGRGPAAAFRRSRRTLRSVTQERDVTPSQEEEYPAC